MMRNPTKHLLVALSISSKARVLAFPAPFVHEQSLSLRNYRNSYLPFQQRFSTSISSVVESDVVSTPPSSSYIQAHRALLISSFTEGVQKSKKAREFLKSSILSCMMEQEVRRLEQAVALQAVELADQQFQGALSTSLTMDDSINSHAGSGCALRFIYIPTARYALKSNSPDTPGKQRRHAEAVAKERRLQIVTTLASIFSQQENEISIHSVTMDFDDGSIKYQEGSKHPNDFPKTGKQALREWNPHLIYVDGGNTFWLHHCMEKGGWRSDLMNLIASTTQRMSDSGAEKANAPLSNTSTTVYCGRSAGAILAGATIETATWKRRNDPSVVPGRESYDAWLGIPGLDLLGGASIFPHMAEQWESLVAEKMVGFDGNVYCLSDSQMCLVDGDQQTVSMIQSDE